MCLQILYSGPTSQNSHIFLLFLDFITCFPPCWPVTRPPRLRLSFSLFFIHGDEFLSLFRSFVFRRLYYAEFFRFFISSINPTFCSLKILNADIKNLRNLATFCYGERTWKGGEWAKSNKSNHFRCLVSDICNHEERLVDNLSNHSM